MNTTKNISLGGYAFIVEEDAYERLQRYTGDVRRNLAGSPGFEEMMADIEGGIAEILRESKGGREVVNLEDVNTVIRRMGEPEVYVQDDNGGAKKADPQPETDEEPGERRLHRDPDNKIIGGVCGGLGAYAGIDPFWFRLLFALAAVFYSAGFWLYIILWVIMPVAKTRLQKLQMRGKKPDLKNIENSIRSELGDVGKNFDRITNDKTVRDGIRRASGAAGDLFAGLFRLIGKILELALKVFAGVVAIVSLAFLGILIFALVTGTYSVQVSDGEINMANFGSVLPHLFENGMEGWMFYTFIFLFLVIPTVALLANSIRYLANLQTKTPKWVSILAVSVWVMALAGLLYSGFRLMWDFTQQATGKSEKTFAMPTSQTLYLRMTEEETDGDGPGFLMDNVWLDVREAKDSVFTLRIYREASGRTYADADRRQRMIAYEPLLKDSLLSFPRVFRLPQEEVVREQSVTMELYVPHGHRIYMEPGLEVLLNDVDNIQNEHDSRMSGRYWIMTEKGLSCEGCAIPEPDSTDVE